MFVKFIDLLYICTHKHIQNQRYLKLLLPLRDAYFVKRVLYFETYVVVVVEAFENLGQKNFFLNFDAEFLKTTDGVREETRLRC